MYRSRQDGFTAVETILIVFTVAVIAFVGWRIYDTYMSQNQTGQTPPAQTQEEGSRIENAEDLAEAEASLSQEDIDGELDTSEIDATLGE